jgi:hypothetical protein
VHVHERYSNNYRRLRIDLKTGAVFKPICGDCWDEGAESGGIKQAERVPFIICMKFHCETDDNQENMYN